MINTWIKLYNKETKEHNIPPKNIPLILMIMTKDKIKTIPAIFTDRDIYRHLHSLKEIREFYGENHIYYQILPTSFIINFDPERVFSLLTIVAKLGTEI